MQITRAGEYAVIGLLYLSRQPAGRTVMIEQISEAERIPRSFLAKIFQSLVKGGLVRSHRGARGGFSLAQPTTAVNLLQVFQCAERAFALQKCVTSDPRCVVADDRLRACGLCGVLAEAQYRVNEVFAHTTLADLLQRHAISLRAEAPIAK